MLIVRNDTAHYLCIMIGNRRYSGSYYRTTRYRAAGDGV